MQEDTGPNVTVAAPLRSFAQRFAFVLLLGASVSLLMVGRTDPKIFEQARMVLIDSTAPVLDGLAPGCDRLSGRRNIRELAHLRQENTALKAENTRLLQWQHAARTLLAENDQLRTLIISRTTSPLNPLPPALLAIPVAPSYEACWLMPASAKRTARPRSRHGRRLAWPRRLYRRTVLAYFADQRLEQPYTGSCRKLSGPRRARRRQYPAATPHLRFRKRRS